MIYSCITIGQAHVYLGTELHLLSVLSPDNGSDKGLMNGNDAMGYAVGARAVHFFLLAIKFFDGFQVLGFLCRKNLGGKFVFAQYPVYVFDVARQISKLLAYAFADELFALVLFLGDV